MVRLPNKYITVSKETYYCVKREQTYYIKWRACLLNAFAGSIHSLIVSQCVANVLPTCCQCVANVLLVYMAS
jgi:hypothetical protein